MTSVVKTQSTIVFVIFGLLVSYACNNGSTESKNNPPIITTLKAIPDTVVVGGTSRITCVASDPDGDDLTYIWEAEAGSINDSASIAIWTAPNGEGSYSISCKVDDGNGGQNFQAIYIQVIPDMVEFISGFFYYGNNQQIPIFRSKKVICVKFDSSLTANEAEQIANQFELSLFNEYYDYFYLETPNWSQLIENDYVIMNLPDGANWDDYVTHYPKEDDSNMFGSHPYVYFSLASYAGDESCNLFSRLFLGDEFVVKSESDSVIVAEFCSGFSVLIDRENQWGEYILTITSESPKNTLDMANHFYEDSLFIWSLPNFIAMIVPE